jgi:ornithine cyclodeaminase/alanine dehydrogenase-like protein (mu-crystallin family)
VREIDEHVVLRSCVVVDEWEQGLTEHGEIVIPIEQGAMRPDDVRADLGEVVSGRRAPRRDPECRWTLFLSGGTGLEDVAVATRLYERALEKGVGAEFEFGLPYEFEL